MTWLWWMLIPFVIFCAYIAYKSQYVRILSDQKIGIRVASGEIKGRAKTGWQVDLKPFWEIAQEYPKAPFTVSLGTINVNTRNGKFLDDPSDPDTERFVSGATIGIQAAIKIFFPSDDRILLMYERGIVPEQRVLEEMFKDIARELLLTVAGSRTWAEILSDVRKIEDAVNERLKKEFLAVKPDDQDEERVWARVGFQYRDVQFVISDVVLPPEIRKERDGVSARRFARESAKIRAEEDAFKLLEPIIQMKALARGLSSEDFLKLLKGDKDLQRELEGEVSELRTRYLSAEHGALYDFRWPIGDGGGTLPFAAVLGSLLRGGEGGATTGAKQAGTGTTGPKEPKEPKEPKKVLPRPSAAELAEFSRRAKDSV